MAKHIDEQKREKDSLKKNEGVTKEAAMVVKSPEPLENEMLKLKKLYIVCLVSIAVGMFFPPLLAIGILALILLYSIDYRMVKYKRKVLRYCKFKFIENIDNEDMFTTMQPIFISKYKMLVEKGDGGIMTLTHDDYMYDINIEDDSTFTIWWRMSLGKAFLPQSQYKSYRKILASMGIISYEIQNAYHIQ